MLLESWLNYFSSVVIFRCHSEWKVPLAEQLLRYANHSNYLLFTLYLSFFAFFSFENLAWQTFSFQARATGMHLAWYSFPFSFSFYFNAATFKFRPPPPRLQGKYLRPPIESSKVKHLARWLRLAAIHSSLHFDSFRFDFNLPGRKLSMASWQSTIDWGVRSSISYTLFRRPSFSTAPTQNFSGFRKTHIHIHAHWPGIVCVLAIMCAFSLVCLCLPDASLCFYTVYRYENRCMTDTLNSLFTFLKSYNKCSISWLKLFKKI